MFMLSFCGVCDRLEMVLHQILYFQTPNRLDCLVKTDWLGLPLCGNTFFLSFHWKTLSNN